MISSDETKKLAKGFNTVWEASLDALVPIVDDRLNKIVNNSIRNGFQTTFEFTVTDADEAMNIYHLTIHQGVEGEKFMRMKQNHTLAVNDVKILAEQIVAKAGSKKFTTPIDHSDVLFRFCPK